MTAAQWVVFSLAGHEYALPLGQVVEVIHIIAITPVAEAPAWLAGVINLRGQVLPVMDTRARLGLPPHELNLSARILVTAIGERWLGLIVDAATEVLTQPAEGVELPATPAGFAVIRTGDRLITVLDLGRLSAELPLVNLETNPAPAPKGEQV